MKQAVKNSSALKEAEKAIDRIKRIIPKLSEGERATLELILDEEAQKQISKSQREIKGGEFITLEEFKKS